MGKNQTFRANVGVIVADGAGKVLALQRAGHPGAWQLPQGGLDVGEEPEQAAFRELEEETGLRPDQVVLEAVYPRWLVYELPEAARHRPESRGQAQRWFLVRLVEPGVEVDPAACDDPEFDAACWMSLGELAARTWEVRRPIYEELARHWAARLAP